MTDQIDQITDNDVDEIQDGGIHDGGAGRRRRMFLTGAGIAGAAAIVGKSGVASAADGDDMLVGGEYEADTATELDITAGPADIDGDLNAFRGIVSDATNGSHAILGTTVGQGHAIAGVSNNTVPGADDGTGAKAATWGQHSGPAAATEGVSVADAAEIGGPANGVKGIVELPGNGSHAVLGTTNGGGHSVAGDTPADAAGDGGAGLNTAAATGGNHRGAGAGIGGVSAEGYGGEFQGGKASVRLIPADTPPVGTPGDGTSQRGELVVDDAGNLYYNVDDGANFTQLNNQVDGGEATVIFTDPQRAYDSREGEAPNSGAADQSRFGAGDTRTIDLTEFTDVPAGAKAALLNISVDGTSPRGFLTAFNGDTDDADRPLAASITWGQENDRATNSLTVRPNGAGAIKVYTSTPTEIIIDVTGYLS